MRDLNRLSKMKLTKNKPSTFPNTTSNLHEKSNAKKMLGKIFITLLILSFLGFFDATFLSIIHYKNITPPCTITQGCERVLSSKFAVIYGIPLSDFGIFYFLASIFLNVLIFQHFQNSWLRKTFMIFNISGVAAAVILLYLQFIVLKALCQYCMLVELILFLSFYFSILLLKSNKFGLQQKI